MLSNPSHLFLNPADLLVIYQYFHKASLPRLQSGFGKYIGILLRKEVLGFRKMVGRVAYKI
jgi:hypothetical protein